MSSKIFLSLGLSFGIGLGLISLYYYRRYKREQIPKKWRRVGTLATARIYPVKSCAPLQLQTPKTEINCEVLGMRLGYIRDRGFMLVNDEGTVITARIYPKMVLIRTKISGLTKITFQANNMEDIELDLIKLQDDNDDNAPHQEMTSSIWGSKITGKMCGEAYDKWWSQAILQQDSGLHLFYYNKHMPAKEIIPAMRDETVSKKSDTSTFASSVRYLLINLASLEELNARTQTAIEALQFRSNFDIKMDNNEAFVEDHWNWIKIGKNAIFRVICGCPHCTLPNINVQTGERDTTTAFEPLNALKKFRLGKKCVPLFGVYLGLRQSGKVKANDVVYVEDY